MSTSNSTAVPAEFTITDLPAGSEGSVVFNLNIALLVISTILLTVRLYVRAFMVKALGLDDLLATIGWGVLTALSSIEILNVYYGSGTHLSDIPPERIPIFFSYLTTLQLLYYWGVGIVRMSIAAFYPRLNSDRMFLRCIYAVQFVIFAITMIAFFFELTECKNIPDLWDITAPGRQCLDKAKEAPMMWSHGAIGILIDIALVALPIWVIASKMKWSIKTLQVILVFCVGLFAIITGVVRLIINVNTDFTTDTTFKMARVAPWTDLEGHIGLWTACFPSLQPVIRLVSYKLGLRSRLDSSNKQSRTGRSGGPTAGSRRGATNASKNWTQRSQGYMSFSDDKDDADSGRVIVHVGSGGRKSPSEHDLELYDLEHGVNQDAGAGVGARIHKRTDVRITVASSGESSPPPKRWNAI